ncbi:MAG: HEAT repeat domain-containing protein [Planctomycetota bacterium]
MKLDEPDHPLVKPFSGPFLVNDEIYLFKKGVYSRERSRVLLTLDMENPRNDVGDKGRDDGDHAISWIHSAGDGRVFYCGFGHHPHIFWTPSILRHSLAGIQYAIGDIEADDTPSAELSSAPTPERTVSAAKPFMDIVDWDWGDSRKKLAAIRKQIRTATKDEKKKLEKRLVATLEFARSTYAARQFACRMLRRIGTCYSVPALEDLLDESDLSHMARFALQRMPCDDVDPALRRALDQVRDKLKVGIISSIGAREDQKAIPQLTELLEDDNSAVAHAAIDALASIGGPEAENALAEADVASSLQDDLQQARVVCADDMLAEKMTKQARAIYRELWEDSDVATVRGAALRGLVRSGASGRTELLLEALESDSRYMQQAAAKFLHRVEGTDISKALAENMADLKPSTQVMVISALASRGDRVAAQHVVDAIKSDNKQVRHEALEAMASLGSASHVSHLAEIAAGGDQAADIAYQSLVQMTADKVNDKVISMLQDSDVEKPVRKVLVRLTADRGIREAVPALLDMARTDEAGLRGPSAQALADLAEAGDAEDMVNLLVQTGSEAAEKAVVAACRDIEGKATRVKPVVEALNETDKPAAKASLVRVLGQLGGEAARKAITRTVDSDNTDARRTAVRTLANWDTDAPAEKLLDIAAEDPGGVTGILALRGYISMAGSAEGLSDSERLKRYKKAMDAAGRANEMSRVLSGVGQIATPEALNFIGQYLHEKNVKGAAQTAYLSVAKKISASHPEKAREAFQRLIEESENESIVKKARQAAENMHQHNGFIIAWRLAGPYTKEGTGGAELFDVAFAPEKGKDAEWRPVRGGQSNPWMVNLERIIGGDNRVAYLRTGVWSPDNQSARLQIGSDDGVKVWLNGDLVHAKNTSRPVRKSQDTAAVDLEKGWNSLMLKVVERSGNWAAAARFTDDNGQPLDGIKIDPSK